jgi:hypothetical protein
MISLVLWRFSHGRMQLIASLRCSYVLLTGVRVGHNTKTVFFAVIETDRFEATKRCARLAKKSSSNRTTERQMTGCPYWRKHEHSRSRSLTE